MTDTGENGDDVVGSYSWNGDRQSPSLSIIKALADLQDTSPATLDVLFKSIDSKALDNLLTDEKGEEIVVKFRKGDYVITVRDDGEIQIRAADDPET